jgi:hypothetical protein
MIALRLPTAGGGDWWIVTHDLLLLTRVPRDQIHALTLLAQFIVPPPRKEQVARLCLSLEDKLFAVETAVRRYADSVNQYGPPSQTARVNAYTQEHVITGNLVDVLNAIYGVLEVAARLNKVLNPGLPQSFSKQMRCEVAFDISRWPWLGRFFDLRRELGHFSSGMPTVRTGTIGLLFTNPRDLLSFSGGWHEVPLQEIADYAGHLRSMLNAWSARELKRIPPDAVLDRFEDPGDGSPLRPRQVTIQSVLDSLPGPP